MAHRLSRGREVPEPSRRPRRLWVWTAMWVGLGVLLWLGGTWQPALGAEETPAVEGVGAIVKRNQAEARKHAIQDALRKALEQAVADLLDPLVLVDNLQVLETQLYDRTLNYVRSYRVLWEYPDTAQQVYRVKVLPDIALEEVAQAVQTLGLTRPGAARTGLLVLMAEARLGSRQIDRLGQGRGVAARALRNALQAEGFRLTALPARQPWDGQAGSVLTVGRQAGAGIVVVGQATAEKVRSGVAGMPVQAVQATVDARAIAILGGKEIAAARGEATVFHADAILGGTQALEKAALEVASRLRAPLLQYQQHYLGRLPAPSEVQ